jgi:predicted negative regulator of RcsB-dependent stress response
MAYDLEEQEQIDALKNWWADNGKLVMLAAIVCLLTIAGFQGWRYYKAQQIERAATLFVQLEQAQQANQHKTVRDIAAQIEERHGSTQYAGMAALAAAKSGVTTGELEDARKHLQWAVEKAREEEMRDVARLRLAGVLLDEKKYDEALKVLSSTPSAAYEALYADLRGDVLATQGKLADARTAYQAALEKSDAGSRYRPIIELKLDALGEAK